MQYRRVNWAVFLALHIYSLLQFTLSIQSDISPVAKCRCPSSVHRDRARDGHPVLTNTQLWVGSQGITTHKHT